MSSNFVKRRLNEFKVKCGKYGNDALHLAYHAALPVALNPELLHFLRINFFLDPPNQLPFIVEFELLTGLCREIDIELYEIKAEIRDELLQGLIKEYGFQRIREVASLLWQYVEYHSPWTEKIELERAQQLTALNFLDSVKAKQWLNETEANASLGMVEEKEWFIAAMRQDIERLPTPSDSVYQKNALEQTYALQSRKVANIRKALVIETEASYKSQYEQQLQEEERNLKKLGDELQALEQELQSNEDSVLQQETSIHIEGSYIINILDNIVLHNEPANVAFPQANKFERVVDILSLLSKSDLIEDEITEKYNFDARQTRYYTDAGRYLDLITKSPSSAKDKSIFSLTDKGQYIMNQKYNQRFIDLTKAILQHEIFYKVFKSAINLKAIPSTKIIIEIMQASSINMSDQTLKRRASTVKAWIEWIWTQVNWKI